MLAGDSTLEELLRVTDVPSELAAGPVTERPARERGARKSRSDAAAPASVPLASSASAAPLSLDFTMDMELIDEGSAGATAASKPPKGGACILLVEDEDQLRRVMRALLEREGYTVTEAGDGVQALDQVDRFAPDIIVLDLNLPGMDGYNVLEQLRSRPATRDIPVVVLTAKGDEDNEVRVFGLGADDFITKPFRARALSARLEAVLGRRRS